MAETLSLRSKAVKVFNYKNLDLSEYIPEFTPDEEALKKDMDRMLKAFGMKIEGESVEAGDMAVITCTSETPKFNKKGITVIIGKGYFSKELEEKLIGVKKGENFSLEADGALVNGTVDRIVRPVVPEMTDESIAKLGIEGVGSVKDLKAFCVDKQIEKLLDEIEEADMASAYLWQKLSEESVFELDEEELKKADEEAAIKEKELEAQKVVFETEEERIKFEKEYEEEYGEPYSEVDFGEFTKNMYRMELQLAALGYEEALKQGTAATYEEYENYIDSIKNYYPNLTMEEMKVQFPVEKYIKERYNDIICKELDDYVHSEFKKKMNPYR
jgi:FKBP-type peptidyl-prolyl cis-trans isomerase (trigger factor)